MPRPPGWLALLVALTPGVAAGQAPPPPPPPPALEVPAVGVVEPPPPDPLATLAGQPAPATGQRHWVAVNLTTLQPFTGRVQFKVWPRPNDSLWLEAYAGSVLFDGMYGFGGRVQHTAWDSRNRDVITVGPGLGVHILPHWEASRKVRGPDGYPYRVYTANPVYFLAGDVDVAWLHDFGPHFGFELGVKVGIAGRVGGTVGDKLPAWTRGVMFGRDAYPILSLYSGLRF